MSTDQPTAPHHPVVVVLAFDDNYVNCSLVAMTSAVQATREPIRFVIVDGGITAANRARLERAVAPHPVLFGSLPDSTWDDLTLPGPNAAYARIGMDLIVPDDIDRVVYLDSDTLINQSLRDLLDTDLHGRTLGASPDLVINTMSTERARWGIPDWEQRGIPAAMMYFNTGVMVIDLARWRETEVRERVLDTLRTGPIGADWDQGHLNRVLWSDWWPLDAGWNGRDLDDAIAHFDGPSKPWKAGYRATPVKQRYVEVADAVGWKLPGARFIGPRTTVRRWVQLVTPPALRTALRR